MESIAVDPHQHGRQARIEDTTGSIVPCSRITHEHGALREFLAHSEAGSAVTVNRLASATGLWAKWYHEFRPYQATSYQEAHCSCWRSLVLCMTLVHVQETSL